MLLLVSELQLSVLSMYMKIRMLLARLLDQTNS